MVIGLKSAVLRSLRLEDYMFALAFRVSRAGLRIYKAQDFFILRA